MYNFVMVDGLLFIAGLFLYFLPSIIARDKRHAAGIITLNFLLGWTFVGWIAAFIWALAAEKEIPDMPPLQVARACPVCGIPTFVGQRFCHSCGTGLAWQPTTQNQLIAPTQSQR